MKSVSQAVGQMTKGDFPPLAVFVKNLIPGTFKTRIADEKGLAVAREVYIALLKITEKAVAHYPGEVFIYFNNSIPKTEDFSFFKKMAWRVQKGSDLGERMSNAFAELLSNHSGAILIGSDCPVLNLDHLWMASEMLRQNEVVFGPAEDGGYYLIGMNRHYSQLFENIPWSTASVLDNSMRIAHQSQLSFDRLPVLYDVDKYSDWKRFINSG